MLIQKLNENWQMCINNTEEFMPAAVPGSVYQDLLDNNKMEDPYYRDNELKALKIMENDFTYVTCFDVPEDIRDIGGIPRLYGYLLARGLPETVLNKVFFENAWGFWKRAF